MNRTLSEALRYAEMGFSVIPIQAHDKKPLLAWERYQKERASTEQIERWWAQKPDANVAIVTGEVSGVDVLDIDSEKGDEALSELLPEVFETPIAVTPRGGKHIYVAHRGSLGNAVRFINDCDFRGQGGYVVAPPSTGQNGKTYAWNPYLSIFDLQPAPLPENIYKVLINAFGGCGGDKAQRNRAQQGATSATLSFELGQRDEALFHVAHSLIKGGMTPDNALICLKIMASQCNPPFSEKEIPVKIESALKRISTRERNLTAEIREWVSATNGNFSATSLYQDATIATSEDKHKARTILARLVQEGLIERDKTKNGWYRRRDPECPDIDWQHATGQPLDLKLPLGIEEYVKTMPKNLIVIAGEPDSGKSAFLLRLSEMNMGSRDIYYFSSEMGSDEIKGRLAYFNLPHSAWARFHPKERSSNFADVIRPDEVNIIDFLELHDDFYRVGGMLKEIQSALGLGIAIVALQKNRGTDWGLGGQRGMEIARLYLTLGHGSAQIRKAKNWASTQINPNGFECSFKIVNGCSFIQTEVWHKATK